MTSFHIEGVPDELADAVRRTYKSPGYGHPVHREIATGTGPCRACLRPFRTGEEERLLFTYRPADGNGTLAAPGPVFIHAESCTRYRAASFPAELHEFPVILEARAKDNRVPDARRVQGAAVNNALAELFARLDVDHVHVRHGVAGCHIARVDRGPLP